LNRLQLAKVGRSRPVFGLANCAPDVPDPTLGSTGGTGGTGEILNTIREGMYTTDQKQYSG
jgi:hypothetical protein